MASKAANLSELTPGHPCFDCEVRSLAVCGALEAGALRQFRESGIAVRYDAGETIVFEGDVAAGVFSLTAGLIRLSKLLPDGRRQIAGFLFPGDFLGITLEEEHAFTAEAVCPSILCRFSRTKFDEFVATHPSLERRLYAVAAHELAAARQQLVLLGRKTATERLASFLLMLGGRCATDGHQQIILPMSRQDIADYLGLRIETVSRELTRLKISRIIRLTGRQSLEIIDRDRLRLVAEQPV